MVSLKRLRNWGLTALAFTSLLFTSISAVSAPVGATEVSEKAWSLTCAHPKVDCGGMSPPAYLYYVRSGAPTGVYGFYLYGYDLVFISLKHLINDPDFAVNIAVHETAHYVHAKSGKWSDMDACDREAAAFEVADDVARELQQPKYVIGDLWKVAYGCEDE